MTKRTNTITIHIDGPQGSGKSRAADIIAAALRTQGFAVTVNDGGRSPQAVMRMAPDHVAVVNVEQK
jgi:adenylylsulfate kinase-like enzyme